MAANKIVAITIFTLNTYMRIGLSQSIINYNGFAHDAIDHGWYSILSGHNLFCIPNTLNQDFNAVTDNLDSLILTGGEYTELRTSVELALVRNMTEHNKPIIGIADSAFEIAESIGGELASIERHSDADYPIFYHREVLEVNNYHSKFIKNLPKSANVLCLDYLGNVQSFINENVAGIVWNPEKMSKPWIPPEIAYMLRI